MDSVIRPAHLRGTLAVPPSKSEAHRRMICAALTPGQTCLTGFASSKDMTATMNCLTALGASFRAAGDTLTVTGLSAAHEKPGEMDCGESGSTLRFIIPVALALSAGGTFLLHGRLAERPLGPYAPIYAACGITAAYGEKRADGATPYTVQGRLQPGDYTLPGNVSSQFVTGMLYALPCLAEGSTLTVTPPVESAGYIAMTLQCLRDSGVTVEETAPFRYRIPGGQRFAAKAMRLPGDWSQGAVPLCAAAMGHDVAVTGLSRATTQGDAAVLDCLRLLGADIREDTAGLHVTGGRLRGAVFSGRDIPDIVPILALTCTQAVGESRITDCGRLRIKECDRFAATIETLSRLGANVRGAGDDLVIRGSTPLHGGVTLPDYNDHRMVMLGTIAATLCDAPVTVTGVQALEKSWPTFLTDILTLEEERP